MVYEKYRSGPLDIGVAVKPAKFPFERTSIIKVVPRFMLQNNFLDPLVYLEENSDKQQVVPAPDGDLKNNTGLFYFEN